MANPLTSTPQSYPRARSLPIWLGRAEPGPLNAITDVPSTEVGLTTILERLGPDRLRATGVTAILPRGRAGAAVPVWGAFFSLNGNGECTGVPWLEETGVCQGPVLISNTNSCGMARDTAARWMFEKTSCPRSWLTPVSSETWDGFLNGRDNFHLTPEHVVAAIEGACGGPVPEGSVGGGTGSICYQFKGGTGTASRRVVLGPETFTLGVLVQANHGKREEFVMGGFPLGRHIPGPLPGAAGQGSLVAVLVTDAPLLPHQLKRVARRMALGMGRSGAFSSHFSGDLFLALSTANEAALEEGGVLRPCRMVNDAALDPCFSACVEAVDEAILNAVVANATLGEVFAPLVPVFPYETARQTLGAFSEKAAPLSR